MSEPTIHRFPEKQEGAFVNAYLVETSTGVVAVDGLLTVSASKAMRDGLERIGKPLRAVLVTQAHPDHYAGLAQIVARRRGADHRSAGSDRQRSRPTTRPRIRSWGRCSVTNGRRRASSRTLRSPTGRA